MDCSARLQSKPPKTVSRWKGGQTPTRPGETNMKLSMFLIASVTALSLSFGLNPAHAGDSFVSIEQYGGGNESGSSQHGHSHRLTVYQNGYGNSSINSQEGAYNKGVIGQDGFDHFVDTYQRGSHNIVGIAQFGAGHTAITTQDGHGNAIGVIQG